MLRSSRPGPRRLRDRGRAQVAVRAEGLCACSWCARQSGSSRLHPRGDVRAPRAGRAGRRRPHARILAPVSRAQAVAGAARARARRLPQRDRAQPVRGAPVRGPRPRARRARAAGGAGAVGRALPPHRHERAGLDEHNRTLAAALRADGRVYVSGADIDGTACLRPCFVNFRTGPEDVRVLRDVVLELGAALA